MPKNINVDPQKEYNEENIKFEEIPAFTYKNNLKFEVDSNNLTLNDVKEILFQMKMIRAFESFLENWKLTGEVNNKPYNFPGPAHISIGQEASAVGQYFKSTLDDINMGTHRNHSEVLAKAFSIIYNVDSSILLEIMKTYFDGEIYEIISKNISKKDIKEQAKYYILYGFLAEILAKQQGFNRGLGGSMHMFFAPFGIFPNNAVVGAGLPLAFGAAMFKLQHQKDGVVISNIGDGGVSTGPVSETLHFASMDQFKTMWETPYNKNPPLMINISNNFYGMGGQTKGETMGYGEVARIGAGFNKNNLFAKRVNANDVLAVIDAMNVQKELAKNGNGPILTELVTYRISGHSTGDAQKYRSEEEVDVWKTKYDPIKLFEDQVLENSYLTKTQIKEMELDIETKITEVFNLVINPNITTSIDFETNENYLEKYMYSNEKSPNFNLKKLEMNESYEDNIHIKRNLTKKRYAIYDDNKVYSSLKRFQIRDAIFESIFAHLYKNPSLLIYGEEHRFWEGAYGVYRDLTKSTPNHRFFNTPIAEAAIVGSAVGYAMSGGQCVVEIMYFDFLWRCGDEIANQLGKWIAMSGGYLKIPVVIRFNIGYGYGAQHSQDLSSVLAHIPGINIVCPVSPYDAKGLMTSCLNQTNPVIFIEVQELYDKGEEFVKTGVPTTNYEIKLGEPIRRKQGKDLTIITFGAQLYIAKDAIKYFEKYGVDVELIDLRSIVPLNYEILIKSVQKTGKVILANNGIERNNVMKEIASNLTRFCFDYLDAPPIVLGAKNTIMPSEEYVSEIYPSIEDYLSTYNQNIKPLKNYSNLKNHKDLEFIRRYKKGV